VASTSYFKEADCFHSLLGYVFRFTFHVARFTFYALRFTQPLRLLAPTPDWQHNRLEYWHIWEISNRGRVRFYS